MVNADDILPLKHQSQQILDVTRPTEILVRSDMDLYQATIEEFAINKRKWLGASDDVITAELLDDVTGFVFHNDQHKRVVTAAQVKFLAKKNVWLSATVDYATGLKAAQLYAAIGDRRGFDAMIERVPSLLEDDLKRLCIASPAFPAEWLAQSEVFKDSIKPLLQFSVFRYTAAMALLRAGDPQPAHDYWMDEYHEHSDNMIYRGSALMSLSSEVRSSEILDLVEETLKSPISMNYYDGPKILRRFMEAEDPELRMRAFAICESLAAPKPQPGAQGYGYHYALCELGGTEYADYFRTQVEQHHCSYSMVALLRVLPNETSIQLAKTQGFDEIVVQHLGKGSIAYLKERLQQKRKDQFVCLRLATLLVPLLEGAPDLETETILRKILPRVYDHPNGKAMVELLDRLGATDADELRKNLPVATYQPYHTDKLWQVDDISQQSFLDYLNSIRAEKPITLADVYENSRATTETRARPFASYAMEVAGFGRLFVIDALPFEALPCLTDAICALTDCQLVPEGISLTGVELLRIAWKDRVFEFSVDDNSTWYDPVTLVDVLNTLLETYSDTTRRLYVFDTDLDYQWFHIAFLEPATMRTLVDRFHLLVYAPKVD